MIDDPNNLPHIVEHYLEKYWDHILPIDPIVIAHGLEITVFKCQNLAPRSTQFEFNQQKYIEFNANDDLVRQRFAIAHALGHHALNHKDKHFDIPENFSLNTRDNEEILANQFAVELFMPKNIVHHLIMNLKITDFDQLKMKLGVSGSALDNRLRKLGWL